MAIRTDRSIDLRYRRTDCPSIAAGAFDLGFGIVLWMDVGFHRYLNIKIISLRTFLR